MYIERTKLLIISEMRIFSTIIITLLLSLPLFFAPKAAAQSVGVVMSGGGAKGLYHIGVLRALEENEIPIDYIAGTSMGSIIGAMYASGYSVEEMEQVALSGDMAKWVSGSIDPKYKYYYMERDKFSSMLTLRFDTNSRADKSKSDRRLHLPISVINTAEIDVALNRFFAQPSAVAEGDFTRLMIPYLCVATDMNAHTAVVLTKGDLARAVRASMALPVAFPPVEIDSVMMCDGGCYDNFPWRSMDEAFHPDILIGACCVEIESELDNDTSVVDQVMSLITMPSDFNMPEGRSVLIQRAVDASTLDFNLADEIMAQGYNDALKAIPQIRELVARRITDEELRERRHTFRSSWSQPHVATIYADGIEANQQEMVDHVMHMGQRRSEQSELTIERAGENYLTMLSNLSVSSDFPNIRYNPATAKYNMHLQLKTKPNLDVAIGGNISSTAFNQAYVGVKYGWWGRVVQSFSADVLLGPVYTMVRAGGRTELAHRYPLYFDYMYNFNITNTLRGHFGNITPVDNSFQMKVMENFLSLSVGSAFAPKSVADFTLHLGQNGYSYKMADYPHRQYTHFSYLAGALSLERSTLNKPLFPTAGSLLDISAIYVYGRDERDSRGDMIYPDGDDYINMRRQWWGVKLLWEQYFDIIDRGAFSLGYAVEGVFTNHAALDSVEATELSAPQYAPLLHSRMIYMPEFRANYYLGVGIMPTVRIIENLYARLSLYAMWRDRYMGDVMHYMSDFSLIYHTPIGPVSLALTKYDFNTTNNMYLTFNFGYAIFGQKGLFY